MGGKLLLQNKYLMSIFKPKPLPHIIMEQGIGHTRQQLKPGKPRKIQVANDKIFVLNMAKGLHLFYVSTFGLGGIGLVTILFFLIINKEVVDLKMALLSTLPFLLLGLFHLAVYYYNPNKELVLDRMNGTISYPKLYFSKKQITIPFNDVKVHTNTDDDGRHSLYLRDIKNMVILTLSEKEPYSYWSFMVWYMDKNRPLPYSSVFNAFRDVDFERRKAEGFPEPLYASYVETPEYTTEQAELDTEMVESYLKDNNILKR